MALFKISRGTSENLPAKLTDGYAYYCTDSSGFYVDYIDTDGNLRRKQLNANEAAYATLAGAIEWSNITDKPDFYTEAEIDALLNDKASVTDYNESIIGLSVDGTTVTYIKGDGTSHSFQTQDTNTTYSLATDETTGLVKLYATTGSAEDGTMTQKAIKTELDKKVGVSIDSAQNMLIFTI